MSLSEHVPTDDIKIWRYMRLNSFLELLTTNLVQVRIDAFNDPTEGTYGYKDAVLDQDALRLAKIPITAEPSWKEDVLREARLHAIATCWFEHRVESFAMWNIYGRLSESVAIETTVGDLRAALSGEPEVRVERMRYTPLTGTVTDLRDLFFHKRPEFAYEQEIRSLRLFPHRVGSRVYNSVLGLDHLNRFIHRIIVAPGNRALFPTAIQTIVTAMFNIAGLKFHGDIVASTLDEYIVE